MLDEIDRVLRPGGRLQLADVVIHITQGEYVDTYARSAFEDTRRKAKKFGAMGSTFRATKPGRD